MTEDGVVLVSAPPSVANLLDTVASSPIDCSTLGPTSSMDSTTWGLTPPTATQAGLEETTDEIKVCKAEEEEDQEQEEETRVVWDYEPEEEPGREAKAKDQDLEEKGSTEKKEESESEKTPRKAREERHQKGEEEEEEEQTGEKKKEEEEEEETKKKKKHEKHHHAKEKKDEDEEEEEGKKKRKKHDHRRRKHEKSHKHKGKKRKHDRENESSGSESEEDSEEEEDDGETSDSSEEEKTKSELEELEEEAEMLREDLKEADGKNHMLRGLKDVVEGKTTLRPRRAKKRGHEYISRCNDEVGLEKLLNMTDQQQEEAVEEKQRKILEEAVAVLKLPEMKNPISDDQRLQFAKLVAIGTVRKDLVEDAMHSEEPQSFEKCPAWKSVLENAIKIYDEFKQSTRTLMTALDDVLIVCRNIDDTKIAAQFVAVGCISRAVEMPKEMERKAVTQSKVSKKEVTGTDEAETDEGDEPDRCAFTGKAIPVGQVAIRIEFLYLNEKGKQMRIPFWVSERGKSMLFDLYCYKHWGEWLCEELFQKEYEIFKKSGTVAGLTSDAVENQAVSHLTEYAERGEVWQTYERGKKVARGLLFACYKAAVGVLEQHARKRSQAPSHVGEEEEEEEERKLSPPAKVRRTSSAMKSPIVPPAEEEPKDQRLLVSTGESSRSPSLLPQFTTPPVPVETALPALVNPLPDLSIPVPPLNLQALLDDLHGSRSAQQ